MRESPPPKPLCGGTAVGALGAERRSSAEAPSPRGARASSRRMRACSSSQSCTNRDRPYTPTSPPTRMSRARRKSRAPGAQPPETRRPDVEPAVCRQPRPREHLRERSVPRCPALLLQHLHGDVPREVVERVLGQRAAVRAAARPKAEEAEHGIVRGVQRRFKAMDSCQSDSATRFGSGPSPREGRVVRPPSRPHPDRAQHARALVDERRGTSASGATSTPFAAAQTHSSNPSHCGGVGRYDRARQTHRAADDKTLTRHALVRARPVAPQKHALREPRVVRPRLRDVHRADTQLYEAARARFACRPPACVPYLRLRRKINVTNLQSAVSARELISTLRHARGRMYEL